jgi:hypothetical protein
VPLCDLVFLYPDLDFLLKIFLPLREPPVQTLVPRLWFSSTPGAVLIRLGFGFSRQVLGFGPAAAAARSFSFSFYI